MRASLWVEAEFRQLLSTEIKVYIYHKPSSHSDSDKTSFSNRDQVIHTAQTESSEDAKSCIWIFKIQKHLLTLMWSLKHQQGHQRYLQVTVQCSLTLLMLYCCFDLLWWLFQYSSACVYEGCEELTSVFFKGRLQKWIHQLNKNTTSVSSPYIMSLTLTRAFLWQRLCLMAQPSPEN